ncbi:hypothetical protein RI129_007868 [Pyrocoelia pectoralis]|uniref:Cytochrome P450 n=1 Tax=Pyrocoelia pectoralis TaxID=417401 RepID=A0AAN7VBY7_9COLE
MWTIIFLITILLILISFIAKYYFYYYNYWNERGVTAINPIYTFYNFSELVFRVNKNANRVQDLYFKHQDKRYIGLFQFFRPILMVHDLELIKKITITDFNAFPDHNEYPIPLFTDKIFHNNVFSIPAKDGWYGLRSALTPFFSGRKLRDWYPLMKECAQQILDHLDISEDICLNDLFGRYTNEIIGRTTMGISFNSIKDTNNSFFHSCKHLSNFSGLKGITYIVYSLYPRLLQVIAPSLIKSKATDFFLQLVKENMQYRIEAKIAQQDVVSLLMKYIQKRCKKEEQQFTSKELSNATIEEVAAGVGVFLVAGFETVSYTLTYIAYELAKNPDVQEKVCNEIQKTLKNFNGDLTYDAINSMKYMENVISETLRIHLFLSIIDRKCVKSYTIEPEKPGEKPIHLKKGDCVWIPAGAIHNDPRYYPNPQKFDPDRFNDYKTFSYMPFGIGPKNCLGSRFAMLESKLIIIEILRRFEIVPVNKTANGDSTVMDISIGLNRKTLPLNG